MRYLAKFLSIFLCLSFIATTATYSLAIDKQRLTRSALVGEKEFILLLAGDKVSVAQLPLIENGKISVVYQLADVGEEGTAEESSLPSPSLGASGGDAREFEQMPSTSKSLRKLGSEQQIVGQQATSTWPSTASFTEEVHEGARNSGSNDDQEETTTASAVVDGGDGLHGAESRPRRSNRDNNNRPTASNYGTDGVTSGATSDHANAAAVDAIESLGWLNVTSAARSGPTQATNGMALQAATAETTRGRSTAPEEGDKIGSVRFEDFDVHMALGYVFVADSKGRIHRFRLSGYDDGEHLHPYANRAKAASHQLGYDNLGDISPHRRGQNGVAENSISGDGLDENGATYDSRADDDDAGDSNDDANKVNSSGGSGAVTHEQSGRQHPTASGGEVNLVDSDASTAGANHATVVAHRQQQGGNFSQPTKARIIWSRIKHAGLLRVTAAHPQQVRNQELSVHQQSAASATGGALAQNQNQNSATSNMNGSIDNDGNQRVATSNNRADQMESGGDGPSLATSERNPTTSKSSSSSHLLDNDENENEENSNATFLMTNDCVTSDGAQWRTEIAVDWINNVLFVLDKCRLLVVDFDGHNELVLIDNFDKINRPSDIKVDPQNGFLFWLHVGNYENTIYRLDLNSLTEKLLLADGYSNAANLVSPPPKPDRVLLSSLMARNANSQPVALTSSHYAHPIILDLPRHAQLFIIDHKHSKIYVPLAPVATEHGANQNKTQRETSETEVFSSASELDVTHLNFTSTLMESSQPNNMMGYIDNCSSTIYNSSLPQIRGYKLDGTDRGSRDPKSYLSGLVGIMDMTLAANQELFYWLTNNGKVLVEEMDKDSHLADHFLSGESYIKLLHFNNLHNQPKPLEPKYNLRNLIRSVSATASSINPIRPPRLVNNGPINSPSSPDPNHNEFKFARNAPYIILGIIALVVMSIYLIYAFVFQQLIRDSREGSIGGDSSIDANSQVVSPGSFMNPSQTISRWIANKPSTSRSTAASTFNRDSSVDAHDRRDSFDVDSVNYNESNAIDEHYRESQQQSSLFGLETNCLVNFSGWPTNLHDLSNKLYVPVEILQDEALSSINRISIDQLEIERKRPPLGVGHFGTVLQGTITCNMEERDISMRHKSHFDSSTIASSLSIIQHHQRNQIPSSSSSGHGSSSVSSEFITANSCSADATNGDYMTPKSNCQSTIDSDYLDGNQVIAMRSDNYSNLKGEGTEIKRIVGATKFKVAIKKLKDNASTEEKRDFLQEAKLLANFDHPNIVHLIGICLDRGSTLIVMELMLGGDLIRYMQENTPKTGGFENLNQEDLLNICLDIVNGCCYLEELNYIHRDLAARNCLVTSRDKKERVVKLADFGLARDIFKDSYYKKLDDTAMPLKWMAIESLQDQKFTIMSDVWSFGVVMWEVMSYCQEKPYGNMEPFLLPGYLTSGERLRKPDRCTDEIYKLMNECWQQDPAKRPTFKDCRLTLIEIKNRMSLPIII